MDQASIYEETLKKNAVESTGSEEEGSRTWYFGRRSQAS
jgi:hypothetical protein